MGKLRLPGWGMSQCSAGSLGDSLELRSRQGWFQIAHCLSHRVEKKKKDSDNLRRGIKNKTPWNCQQREKRQASVFQVEHHKKDKNTFKYIGRIRCKWWGAICLFTCLFRAQSGDQQMVLSWTNRRWLVSGNQSIWRGSWTLQGFKLVRVERKGREEGRIALT